MNENVQNLLNELNKTASGEFGDMTAPIKRVNGTAAASPADRVKMSINDTVSHVIEQLDELSEEINALRASLAHERDSAIETVANLNKFAEGAISTKNVMSDALKRMRQELGKERK